MTDQVQYALIGWVDPDDLTTNPSKVIEDLTRLVDEGRAIAAQQRVPGTLFIEARAAIHPPENGKGVTLA